MTRIQSIISSSLFNRTIIVMILFSGILLGIETNEAWVQEHGELLKILDRAVLSFFVAEIFLKIAAFGKKPLHYFRDSWNLIDFLIVLSCLIPSGSQAMAVFRLVRVLRVFRLITALPKLQMIVSALVKSIPSLSYVVAILGIHFYMFGVLGTFLFAKNDPVHFGTLIKTFLTLFQTLTLEGWVDTMRIQIYGCANYGYESFSGQCVQSVAQPIAGILYFIAFIVFGTMIILNLLIGVVVNGMAEAQSEIDGAQATQTSTTPISPDSNAIVQEIRLLRSELQDLKSRMK